MDITIINAGAGTGKTYTICETILQLVKYDKVDPSKIITTTFTKKAAGELKSRIRKRLLKEGEPALASEMEAAMVGTVHSICSEFIKYFAFEAGVSPEADTLEDNLAAIHFNMALSEVLGAEDQNMLNGYAGKFSFDTGYNKKDWRQDIKRIADLAWSNDLKPEELIYSGEKSIGEYKGFFKCNKMLPEVSEIKMLLEKIIQLIKDSGDPAAVTAKYADLLKNHLHTLKYDGALPWNCWFDLCKEKPGKKILKDIPELNLLVDSLCEMAASHGSSLEIWNDVENYTRLIYKIASESIGAYNVFKSERSLIDFNDQEAIFLHLLDNESVQNELRERYEVLIVDEFQDTNPMQLSIFLKLSAILKKSVWVGDPKQSIYGFRGADHSMMEQVINSPMVKIGDRLDTSYRSVKDIVHTVNAIFSHAFSAPIKETVPLKVHRQEEVANSIKHWHFQSEKTHNKGDYFSTLSNEIKELIQNPPEVWDHVTGKLRSLVPGDIAILSRTQQEGKELSDALKKSGIEASVSGCGLLSTMEGRLMMACLKKLHSYKDSLATAEILYLTSDAPDIEHLIEERIEWLSKNQPANSWGEESTVIQILEEVRSKLSQMTPLVVMQTLIEQLQLDAIVKRWGNGRQREAGLFKFYSFAQKFEEACKSNDYTATLQGLILFLENLVHDGEDEKPSIAGPHAVNIFTYHGAKGLEWPFVILSSLDFEFDPRIFEPYVVNGSREATELNATNALEARRIRYWVSPYFGKKTSWLHDQIKESAEYSAKCRLEEQETKRLLYVGMTRARDYLVFSSRSGKNGLAWMENVVNGADDYLPQNDKSGIHPSPWSWDDQKIQIETKIIPVDKEAVYSPLTNQQGGCMIFDPPTGRIQDQRPFRVNPSKVKIDLSSIPAFHKDQVEYLGARLDVKGTVEEGHFGNMFHAFMAIFRYDLSKEENILRAQKIITQSDLSANISAEAMAGTAWSLYDFFQNKHQVLKTYTELPLQMMMGGQLYTGTADLLFEIKEGLILIDHKSFIGSSKLWGDKYVQHYGQISTYCTMVEAAFMKPVVKAYLHFPVGGGLVEMFHR